MCAILNLLLIIFKISLSWKSKLVIQIKIMKKLTLLFALNVLVLSIQAQLIEVVDLGTKSIAELQITAGNLGVPSSIISVDHDVNVYRLIYQTPDPQGNMTTASGALLVPQGVTCAVPLASYQHGTMALKMEAPSFNPDSERLVGLLFASTGYVVSMPDYLGLGASPGLHPYVHAKSQATATIDMMRATRTFAANNEVPLNGQVMLFGYSQGGHATMAAHKEIQENHADEFDIAVSVPMSGPYDISGAQTEVILLDEFYPTPGYVPYVMLAYQEVYGGLFNDPSEVFKPEYVESVIPLFDGTHSMGFINNMCPDIPNQIFLPEVLDSFRNDPNHRFWAPLRDNDLYDWVPEAPVKMLYCTGDDQVSFMNSVVALDAFTANGATNAEASNLGTGDHGECFNPALISCKLTFDSYKKSDNGITVIETITEESSAGAGDGSISLEVSGGVGNLTYEWNNGNTTTNNTGLIDGFYGVTITDEAGCSIDFTYFIFPSTTSIFENNASLPLNIFPNPTNGDVLVELPVSNEAYDLEVRNINGQLVFAKNSISGQQVMIKEQNLPKGMLIVLLKGEKNYREKIIVY